MHFSTKTACDSNGGATLSISVGQRGEYAEELQWCAFQTRPRWEKKTTEHLKQQGLEIFLPLLRQVHRWSDRQKVVEVPLFTGYGFVRLQASEQSRIQVLRTPGVIAVVGAQGAALAIPTSQIENLRQLLSTDARIAGVPFLTTGKRVRVRGGALDGVEGILQENDGRYLVISIDALQRSVAMKVEGYSVEMV